MRFLPAALLLISSTAAAQTGAVASIKPLFDRTKGWYVASAEQMPEADYAYKPTADVRTFGQILGHIVNENYLFCAAVLGEKDPNTADWEKVTSKAELMKGLNAAFAYCDRAYEIPDAGAMAQVEFFGMKGTKLWALAFNVEHDGEHYGNIVTYFRMKGMVPPSSRGQ